MIRWHVEWISQFGEHHKSIESNTDDLSEMVRMRALTAREIHIKMHKEQHP